MAQGKQLSEPALRLMQAAVDARDDLRRLVGRIDEAERTGEALTALQEARIVAWRHADRLRLALKRP